MSSKMESKRESKEIEMCPHYAVMELKFWISQQPTIPELPDNVIKTFLHSCYYSVKDTKDTLTSYFCIRLKTPKLFHNRNIDMLKSTMNLAYFVKFPELSEEGYEVLLSGLYHNDASEFNFTDLWKFFIMATETWAFTREENPDGVIVVSDCANFTFSHLKKMEFGVVKTAFQYFQDALPIRLKKIILINVSNPVYVLLSMMQTVIAKRLVHLIDKHNRGSTEYFNIIPQKMFPLEYGGDCRAVKDLNDDTIKMLQDNQEWFDKETEELNKIAENQPRRSSIFDIFF